MLFLAYRAKAFFRRSIVEKSEEASSILVKELLMLAKVKTKILQTATLLLWVKIFCLGVVLGVVITNIAHLGSITRPLSGH